MKDCGDAHSGTVEWHDVQSLVRRPYKDWPVSAHLILHIEDPAKAKAWLRGLIPDVRVAGEVYPVGDPTAPMPETSKEPLHFAVAFSAPGLGRLGVTDTDLATFDPAFVEGMAPDPVTPPGYDPANPALTPEERQFAELRQQGSTRRAGILGDLWENHASNWDWGGIETLPDGRHGPRHGRVLQKSVDILLMVFSKKPDPVGDYVVGLRKLRQKMGVRIVWDEITELAEREHFGFLDGLSQPIFPDSATIDQVSERWHAFHKVQPGEFVLGYRNERDELPESPSLTPLDYPDADLPERRCSGGPPDDRRLDIGRNGTYLVARQLHQNVGTFDRLVERAADLIKGDHEPAPTARAAGLLMGRGLDGDPLVPDHGEPQNPNRTHGVYNDYGFHQSDPAGLLCPIGSHVRRANPRDSLEPNPDAALLMSKQHRIIRRSRIYGARSETLGFWEERGWQSKRRVVPPPASDAERAHRETLRRNEDRIHRGLFFMCLNTDIAGQFEFIQDTWLNNPNFGDLEKERDAILAASVDVKVSLPSKPFTRRMNRADKTVQKDPRPVVEVRGGAYFFLPGRSALMALSHVVGGFDALDSNVQDILQAAAPEPTGATR